VTLHFLTGAAVVLNLPRLQRRFGLPWVTVGGAFLLALGIVGWAQAVAPWQLLLATLFSGSGWVALSAAGVNAMVSPWFVAQRPRALSMAYNGASIGGVVFSPLWVALIAAYGFGAAALGVALVMFCVVASLALTVLKHSPQSLGQRPDGTAGSSRPPPPQAAPSDSVAAPATSPATAPAPARVTRLWRDRAFVTLAIGMALGLFAQIGLITHLFSLLAPALGGQAAGFALGLATAAAIAGRTLVGAWMSPGADRRHIAVASYAVQMLGLLCFLAAIVLMAASPAVPWASELTIGLLWAGVCLFGFGIGNATSLPPLIAQAEFATEDVPRVVAQVVATAQAAYAFAPWVFGLVRDAWQTGSETDPSAWIIYLAVLCIQALSSACYWWGSKAYQARLA
jgi:MFS family permease